VNIPQHAFVILNVEESVYSASELLSGKRTTVELASTHPFVTDIEAHGAVIWKLTQKKVASKTKKAEKNSTKISKKR
jgi:hypothetical protein